jgi:type I restriction enzyme, S subunit
MEGLNMGIIAELPLLLPSLEQQQKIAESVDSLREETNRLEAIYKSKLEQFDALKKSLLHHAFTGRL